MAEKTRATFRVFKSDFQSWEALGKDVAEFLTEIGPDRVIGVSHSQEKTLGVIIVWYWNFPAHVCDPATG